MNISDPVRLPDERQLIFDSELLEKFLEDGQAVFSADQTIVWHNTCFLKIFGFDPTEEVLAIRFETLFADDEAMVLILDKFRLKGFVLKHRVLCRRKRGENFWAEISGSSSFKGGANLYGVVIRDISEQVDSEDRLRQKEGMLEKLAMELDRFIYSASHEIRSPVTSLLGVINLMKLDLKDGSVVEYVRMLESCCGKLDQIVRQLTTHVRNYRDDVTDVRIDFRMMVEDIFREFRHTHDSFSMITPSCDVQSESVFHSDPDRLRIIFCNIIRNSLDYVDKNKVTRVLSVSVVTAPDKAIIEIFDNGIGIAARHLSRVFDMFYRGTHLTKGSGIGLYTVRETVTRLGGTISLHSEYGIGTSVKIILPNSRKGILINRKRLLRISTLQYPPFD